MHSLKFNSNDFENEKCCEFPDPIISDECMRVCRNCGMVFGLEYVQHERRAYNSEEVKNRRINEPRWRSYGPRTIIGTFNSDAKGNALESRRQQLFNRLSKIQGSLINSIERNYWESRPKLALLGNKLQIPDFVLETAWKIYSEVAKQKLTMGRSIESFVTASLYAAIRIHNFPRLLEEIVEVAMVATRSIHRSLGLLLRLILPQLKLKYRPIAIEPLVYRFGEELRLSVLVQQKGVQILHKACRLGLKKIGKDPKGLAAAALYLSSKKMGERKTQTEIAQVARITEVTLRTRAKQIKAYLD
jgi:transcription initiation factor TFIIB